MHSGRLTIRPYFLHGNWNGQPRRSRNVNLINLPGEYDVHVYLKLGGMERDTVTFLPTIIYGSARSENLWPLPYWPETVDDASKEMWAISALLPVRWPVDQLGILMVYTMPPFAHSPVLFLVSTSGIGVCNRIHIGLCANRPCYPYARASSNHYWFLTGKSETGRQPTIYIYYYSTVRKRSTTPNQLVLPFVADGMKSWRKISASSNYDDLETNLRNIHTWDTNTKLPINAERNSNIYL